MASCKFKAATLLIILLYNGLFPWRSNASHKVNVENYIEQQSLLRQNCIDYLHAMTKKDISRTPAQMQENSAVKLTKESSTPKKPGNEIDEIFSDKKKKKPEQEKTEKASGDLAMKAKVMKKKKKKSKEANEAGISNPPSQPRKKTGDGLSIYTEEELGLGKSDAGSTPLCPFDCECCF